MQAGVPTDARNIEGLRIISASATPPQWTHHYALWEGWHGYDRQKYAAMLREAFEPFEQFTATPRSLPDSLDSDRADDLSRSPLFAALRLLRPGA